MKTDMPAEIYDYLSKHPFTDLSPEQQRQVELHMTPQEYQEYYHIIHDFQQLEAPIAAQGSSIPINKSTVHWFHRNSIPWPVAAALALAVGFFSFLLAKTNMPTQHTSDKVPVLITSQSLADKTYSDSLVFEL